MLIFILIGVLLLSALMFLSYWDGYQCGKASGADAYEREHRLVIKVNDRTINDLSLADYRLLKEIDTGLKAKHFEVNFRIPAKKEDERTTSKNG